MRLSLFLFSFCVYRLTAVLPFVRLVDIQLARRLAVFPATHTKPSRAASLECITASLTGFVMDTSDWAIAAGDSLNESPFRYSDPADNNFIRHSK
jgi:hypothetical protein